MSNEWWGYSVDHGWVVLFRTVPTNAPGSNEDLTFVRCSDSLVFREPKENWIKPKYIFATQYLAAVSESKRDFEKSELSSYEGRSEDLEAALHKFMQAEVEEIAAKRLAASQAREVARLEEQRATFLKSRETYFQNLGIQNPGVRPIGLPRYRRITHCYSCKSQLDNAMDAECNGCGWIVCSCGACGCGY